MSAEVWQDEAACAGDPDPDAWFAPASDPQRRSHALAVCEGCPVAHKCLTDAIERDDRWGIWGGLLPEDRHQADDSREAVLLALDRLGGNATTVAITALSGLPSRTVHRRMDGLYVAGHVHRVGPATYALDPPPAVGATG